MKKSKKIFTSTLIAVLLIGIFYSSANAATGAQGYAVYRDGVFGGLNWHAAIMDEPSSRYSLPVVHHSGSGYVKWDSWTNFMNGKNFKGVYRPNSAPSSSTRDLFVAMGRKLTGENIGYGLYHQVYYEPLTSGDWVDTNEIIQMRCDGVVEYIYEWYGYRVYGSDLLWDVTSSSELNRNAHGIEFIQPQKQTNYLTLVSSDVP